MERWFSAVAALLLPAFFTGCLGDPGPGWGWGPMMHGGFGGMSMWIVFLLVLGALLYFLVQAQKTKRQGPAPPEEGPLEILKRRYAKGEITKDEFERMKKDLEV